MTPPTQQDARGVVYCSAPRKPPRFSGQRCNGFVGRFSGPVRVLGLLVHSDDVAEGCDAVACRRCGFLHEIRRETQEMAA